MQKKLKEILKDEEFSVKYKEIVELMGFSNNGDIKSRDFLHDIFSQREYNLENNILNFILTLLTIKFSPIARTL